MTDIIRIEFDVRRCVYHTQIDAVKVIGFAPIDDREAAARMRKRDRGVLVSRKELELNLKLLEERNNQHRFSELSSSRSVSLLIRFYFIIYFIVVPLFR